MLRCYACKSSVVASLFVPRVWQQSLCTGGFRRHTCVLSRFRNRCLFHQSQQGQEQSIQHHARAKALAHDVKACVLANDAACSRAQNESDLISHIGQNEHLARPAILLLAPIGQHGRCVSVHDPGRDTRAKQRKRKQDVVRAETQQSAGAAQEHRENLQRLAFNERSKRWDKAREEDGWNRAQEPCEVLLHLAIPQADHVLKSCGTQRCNEGQG
mmetsp:Transcript_82273/g.197287  ORF Transcript_82273/g.197287 Transcript_82273/m.197287 type:complete len:214 (+) Transcript_82273:150-791(+)